MICKNCGVLNDMNSKFCISCGQKLDGEKIKKPEMKEKQKSYMDFKAYINFIIKASLKPLSTINEYNEILTMKDSIILSLFVTIFLTILNLLKTMLYTVNSGKLFSNPSEWNWDYLSNINYLLLPLRYFSIIFLLIFLISLIFYLSSLVIKSELKYNNLVTTIAIAIFVYGIIINLISPLFGSILILFSNITRIFGLMYFLVIIIAIINNKININGDNIVYFYVVSFSIAIIIYNYLSSYINSQNLSIFY